MLETPTAEELRQTKELVLGFLSDMPDGGELTPPQVAAFDQIAAAAGEAGISDAELVCLLFNGTYMQITSRALEVPDGMAMLISDPLMPMKLATAFLLKWASSRHE